MIDSFRADKFYGSDKTSKTPNIDFLLQNGTYFEQAISSADATLLSWASLFTGLHPFKTGVRSLKFNKINSNITTYFILLKNSDYSTYAFVPTVSRAIGLFSKFENNDNSYDYYLNLSDGLGTKIINLLDSKKMKEPWIFYVHIEDLHFPIIVPKKYRNEKYGKTKYEQKISNIDEWIGKILEKINLNNTLLILTSDHGTYVKHVEHDSRQINFEVNGELQTIVRNLGNLIPKPLLPVKNRLFFFLEKIRKARKIKKISELDLLPHEKRALLNQRGDTDHYLYDDNVRVPLVFAGYGIEKPIKITQQVRSIDIFPTIMEIIGLDDKKTKDGVSLLPLIKGEKMIELPAYIESTPLIDVNTTDVIGIRTSNFKFFRDKDDNQKSIHLFNLKKDPYEDNNLNNDEKDTVNEMERILQNIISESENAKHEEINEDDSKRIENELKKLGYI